MRKVKELTRRALAFDFVVMTMNRLVWNVIPICLFGEFYGNTEGIFLMEQDNSQIRYSPYSEMGIEPLQ